MTAEELQAFEQEVADAFLDKKIRAPIHLSDGNESQLIEFFKRVRPDDWVFSTWRSHYHALLKGVPPADVMATILDGHSITMMFPDHRFLTTAIVGGIVPIALGTALGIKRAGGAEHVYCFVGDMAATCGVYREAVEYATNFDLPITFVVEDNTQSVGTPTNVVWGRADKQPTSTVPTQVGPKVWAYDYDHSHWPHVGCGRFITF